MHGPVAAIAPGWPVIARRAVGAGAREHGDGDRGLAERGARVLVIADDEDVLAPGAARSGSSRGVPEWLSPLATVIPGQLAAFRLAQLGGSDLDNPHGLSKVTLTV